ncbi:MAG TPA: AMP-binding protein [Terriglobales bacterium]|nr:AMP-binding protein [Terriglobales bacterium]
MSSASSAIQPRPERRLLSASADWGNLASLLASASARYGNKIALICGEEQLSFRDLYLRALRLANALEALDIGRGDRVTLYTQNSWQWIVSYYAVASLGAVLNPINIMLTGEEVQYIANDCGAKAIIAPSTKAEMLMDVRRSTGLKHVIVHGGPAPTEAVAFDDLLSARAAKDDRHLVSAEEISTIMYTSGTTGHPKGAMLRHRNLSLNAALCATVHLRNHSDTVVTGVPLCHVYGSMILNASMLSGATLVLMERFHEGLALQLISSHRATLFEGVPSMLMYMLNSPELNRHDLSSLTRCTTGGQTMPLAKMEEAEERFGCRVLEIWGMTEIAGAGTSVPFYGPSRLGSIGVTLPGIECCIADPVDGVGELMVRGPIVMAGYYGNDCATQQMIESDGWLHTGDLARMEPDGYIYIVDRKKDLIITGGYNVYPAEIERVLAMHPAVAIVAVGSCPHPTKGEIAKAYVVPKRDCAVDEAGLLDFCRQHLAAYKMPRAIQLVPDLPKTSTGKILRRQLHQLDAK